VVFINPIPNPNADPKPRSAGMDVLGARSVASLKKALPTLEATVAVSEAAALDFFQFAFRYCLVVRGPMARACFRWLECSTLS